MQAHHKKAALAYVEIGRDVQSAVAGREFGKQAFENIKGECLLQITA